jgi:hypothetical protein
MCSVISFSRTLSEVSVATITDPNVAGSAQAQASTRRCSSVRKRTQESRTLITRNSTGERTMYDWFGEARSRFAYLHWQSVIPVFCSTDQRVARKCLNES